MDFHPARCVTELACVVSFWVTVAGWLPTVFASAASIAATLYYGLAVYDRFKKGKSHD